MSSTLPADVRRLVECAYQAVRTLNNELAFCPFVLPNLCGACGIASEALCLLLREQGVESTMVVGTVEGSVGHHYWVELDGWVIDITGEQFGFEPVQMLPERPAHYTLRHVAALPTPPGSFAHKDIQAIIKRTKELLHG